MTRTPDPKVAPNGWIVRSLDVVERAGNKLPDPVVLFLLLMLAAWGVSWVLSGVSFSEIDPRTGQPVQVRNLLAGESLTSFMATMVGTFTSFPPLGVVLVAMLGLGVAEHTGFINALLRAAMAVTPRALLTPALIAVGILSHVAVDAGYVLVIPLGAVIFYAAGRHPLAGIAAAFAGVSGGFSATLGVPSSLDPLLAGLSQTAAQLVDPSVVVNPLNNFVFTTASSLLIILVGWALTDLVIEPRLKRTATIDGDLSAIEAFQPLAPQERTAMWAALGSMLVGLVLLALTALPETSAWRSPTTGALESTDAPLMKSIVPLIFVLFLLPGVIYGILAGTVKSHRDVIAGMSKAMTGMGYYLVLVFFCAQFIAAFGQSNLGVLLALEGAEVLKAAALPAGVTMVGIILLTASVNLVIGSASAKWTLLAPIFVPMLMQLGISPDLTQAAYRVGDSSSNIITPLMPYFPLVVVFCQRYVKNTGIGTVVAMMLPFTLTYLVLWSGFLLLYWTLGLPLGPGASYVYPVPAG